MEKTIADSSSSSPPTPPPPARGEPTWRVSARSALLPARDMIMCGLPCRCSSFTHSRAFAKLSWLLMSYTITAAAAPLPQQQAAGV